MTVAGRTDRGVHAWGQVCSYEHEAVDPLRLNAVLPPDVAVLECNPARGRVRRPRRRPLADLLLPPPQPQRPLGTPGGHGPLEPAAPRPRRPGRLRRRAAGDARLHRVHADRDRPRPLRARRVRRALGARRRPARLLDHRRHLHAPHEPRPRRDDDRGRAGAPHGRGLHGAAAGRAAVRRGRRPRRRGAWRSRRSTTARERARCGRRRRRPAPGRARPPWRRPG